MSFETPDYEKAFNSLTEKKKALVKEQNDKIKPLVKNILFYIKTIRSFNREVEVNSGKFVFKLFDDYYFESNNNLLIIYKKKEENIVENKKVALIFNKKEIKKNFVFLNLMEVLCDDEKIKSVKIEKPAELISFADALKIKIEELLEQKRYEVDVEEALNKELSYLGA